MASTSTPIKPLATQPAAASKPMFGLPATGEPAKPSFGQLQPPPAAEKPNFGLSLATEAVKPAFAPTTPAPDTAKTKEAVPKFTAPPEKPAPAAAAPSSDKRKEEESYQNAIREEIRMFEKQLDEFRKNARSLEVHEIENLCPVFWGFFFTDLFF